MTAKQFIEETYGIVLSSKGPYHYQIQGLDAAGALSNNRKIVSLLFFLAEEVDRLHGIIRQYEKSGTPADMA